MKIFVIHYKILHDRKKNILEQFEKHNITDYEFVEIDRDELDKQNIGMFQKDYSKSQIAISLSHFYAYKEIAKKYDYALILEDDAILSDNFMDKLTLYMSQLKDEYDMLFIGDGCNLHIRPEKIKPNKHIYKKSLEPTKWGGNGATRCSDSYIVSNKCAKQLVRYIENIKKPISQAIDWWLNEATRDNNFKVFWAEPTIVTQGSQNNTYKTSY